MEECLSRWSYHLARRQRATADVVTNTRDDVRRAFAYAFAYVMSLQVSEYLQELQQQSRRARPSGNPRPLSVPTPRQLIRSRRAFSVNIRSPSPEARSPQSGPSKRRRCSAPATGHGCAAGSASVSSCSSNRSSCHSGDDDSGSVLLLPGPAPSAVRPVPPLSMFLCSPVAAPPPA